MEFVGGPGLWAGVLLARQQGGQADPGRGQAVAWQQALDRARVGQRADVESLEFGQDSGGADQAGAGGWRRMGLEPTAYGEDGPFQLGCDMLGDVVVSAGQVVEARGSCLQVAAPPLGNQVSERPRDEQICWTARPARRRRMARWRAVRASCRMSSAVRPLGVARGGRCRPNSGPRKAPNDATVRRFRQEAQRGRVASASAKLHDAWSAETLRCVVGSHLGLWPRLVIRSALILSHNTGRITDPCSLLGNDLNRLGSELECRYAGLSP